MYKSRLPAILHFNVSCSAHYIELCTRHICMKYIWRQSEESIFFLDFAFRPNQKWGKELKSSGDTKVTSWRSQKMSIFPFWTIVNIKIWHVIQKIEVFGYGKNSIICLALIVILFLTILIKFLRIIVIRVVMISIEHVWVMWILGFTISSVSICFGLERQGSRSQLLILVENVPTTYPPRYHTRTHRSTWERSHEKQHLWTLLSTDDNPQSAKYDFDGVRLCKWSNDFSLKYTISRLLHKGILKRFQAFALSKRSLPFSGSISSLSFYCSAFPSHYAA